MKTRKVIGRFLAALIVLAGCAAIGIVLFANSAVRRTVESAGTKVLALPVEVEKARVSILGGSLALHEVAVDNPPKYEGHKLLVLREITVEAEAGSLLGKSVRIHDMQLDNMEVFVEQKGIRNNLYEAIEPLRAAREPTGKRLIIDKLAITNVTVHIALTTIPGQPEGQAMTFQLEPITMTDVGRHERLDTPALIIKIVLAVATAVAEQSGDVLPREMIGDLSGILDKAIDLGRVIFGPDGKHESP